jgi:hypothetical protein
VSAGGLSALLRPTRLAQAAVVASLCPGGTPEDITSRRREAEVKRPGSRVPGSLGPSPIDKEAAPASSEAAPGPDKTTRHLTSHYRGKSRCTWASRDHQLAWDM